jgi:hypothetical protein
MTRGFPRHQNPRPYILSLTPGEDPVEFTKMLKIYAEHSIRGRPDYTGDLPSVGTITTPKETNPVVWTTPFLMKSLKRFFKESIAGYHALNNKTLNAARDAKQLKLLPWKNPAAKP